MEELKKLISLERLSDFWEKVKAYFKPKFEALDNKIDKKVWTGTKAELEIAIQNKEVDDKTLIIITDDDDEEIIYTFCTEQDIRRMFGLT